VSLINELFFFVPLPLQAPFSIAQYPTSKSRKEKRKRIEARASEIRGEDELT
jgi:hypothetical protein